VTEQEWLACNDPTPMLEFLRGKASDRKFLMFAVNGLKGTRELCDERLLGLLAMTEEFADGTLSASEVEAHWGRNAWPLRPFAWARALGFRNTNKKREFKRDQAPILVDLVRDLFGPLPFRPSPPLPPAVLAWNDGTVPRIAQGIYDERRMPAGTLETARLAVFADALLDAGCEDEALIQHCREPGPHVRGCWAVDLILGKR
jgi:hypothetical protein